MSKWEMVRLGDVCEINPPKKQMLSLFEGKKVSFVPMANVGENGNIDVSDIRLYSDVCNGFSYFIENDVLFAKITPCMENGKGAIAKGLANGVGVGSTEFHILRANEKYITSDWIYRYLSFPKIRKLAEKNMTGSAGQKRVPKTFLEDVKIPLPPLDVQKHIADILDKTQEIIDGHKRQLEELDYLIKATFYDMFGDPIVNGKKWREAFYKDIMTEKAINGYFTKNENYCANGNASVMWVGDIINRLFSNTENLKSVNATDKDLEKYSVKYGDLLFCRSSLTKEGIGKASIVPENVPSNVMFECHIIKTSVNLQLVEPVFLQVLSTTNYFRNQIISRSKTSTMTTIGQEGITNNTVILPPLKLQNKFAAVVKNIEKQKTIVKQSIAESQNLFNSLMSKYFD